MRRKAHGDAGRQSHVPVHARLVQPPSVVDVLLELAVIEGSEHDGGAVFLVNPFRNFADFEKAKRSLADKLNAKPYDVATYSSMDMDTWTQFNNMSDVLFFRGLRLDRKDQLLALAASNDDTSFAEQVFAVMVPFARGGRLQAGPDHRSLRRWESDLTSESRASQEPFLRIARLGASCWDLRAAQPTQGKWCSYVFYWRVPSNS